MTLVQSLDASTHTERTLSHNLFCCLPVDHTFRSLHQGFQFHIMALCLVCQAPASIFCTNDGAHMCVSCDITIHSCNVLANRHHRVSLLDNSLLQPVELKSEVSVKHLRHAGDIRQGCLIQRRGQEMTGPVKVQGLLIPLDYRVSPSRDSRAVLTNLVPAGSRLPVGPRLHLSSADISVDTFQLMLCLSHDKAASQCT